MNHLPQTLLEHLDLLMMGNLLEEYSNERGVPFMEKILESCALRTELREHYSSACGELIAIYLYMLHKESDHDFKEDIIVSIDRNSGNISAPCHHQEDEECFGCAHLLDTWPLNQLWVIPPDTPVPKSTRTFNFSTISPPPLLPPRRVNSAVDT